MSVRHAACEPCRKGKLACDHARPVCDRCRRRDKVDACTYRTRPFKRQKTNKATAALRAGSVDISATARDIHTPFNTVSSPARDQIYPNPGFLGSSSHATIFNDFETLEELHSHSNLSTPAVAARHATTLQANHSPDGIKVIQHIQDTILLLPASDLVTYWIATGTNLSLAEHYVTTCSSSVVRFITSWEELGSAPALSESLYRNTNRPLILHRDTTLETFTSQFSDENIRWETIGLFFVAVARALLDVKHYAPLFITQIERRRLKKVATDIADQCLDICLSLDCMNDLQLILQVEVFILHTRIDGDQSYRTWRTLGDVISSLFALGYHERVDTFRDGTFVHELRTNAFARIYNADKNLGTFLGRPPRINRRFCTFYFPSNSPAISHSSAAEPNMGLRPQEKISFGAHARWFALGAVLKEQILEASQIREVSRKEQEASIIEKAAEAQWQALPDNFRLRGRLGSIDCSPFERDFLLSVRLDQLHVLFLIRFLLLRHLAQTEDTLLSISEEILTLIVEAVVLKDSLVNAGTSLDWKVAHYGLPAAGVISLALVRKVRSRRNVNEMSSRMRVLRDLSVLVAHIEIGSIVQIGEPNWALFSRAAEIIQRILNHLTLGEETRLVEDAITENSSTSDVENAGSNFNSWLDTDLWDFELDFWNDLGDHPALSGMHPNQVS